MIILGKATEPKAASANSTYPAIVVSVGTANGAFTKLWFFCPSTMSGQPKDAVNPGGNNVVEAPNKPHDGDVAYNYQVGDVIVISYADGNLNTPQFVRYISIDDSVRQQNGKYVAGDKVISDGYFNIADTNITLDSDILAKAISLLPAVRLCAKGGDNTNDIYMIYDGIANPFVNDVILYKCGKYGVELATLDAPNEIQFTGYRIPLTLEYDGGIFTPDTTFLEFCQYLFNGGIYTDASEIIEVFRNAFNETHDESYHVDSIPIDDRNALYLFQALAGLSSWKDGAPRINTAVYNENTEKPVVSLMPYTNDWSIMVDHLYQDTYTDFRQAFWNNFSSKYSRELDRMYAIILHNNIYRLKQKVGNDNATNLSLLIFAVIASALQILEQCIIEDNSTILDSYSKDYTTQLRDIVGIINDDKLTVEQIRSKKSTISDFFSHMYLVLLNRDGTGNQSIKDIQTKIKNNIDKAIDYILGRADELMDLFGPTITGGGEASGQFTWPTPGFTTITSPFGYRNPVYNSSGQIISQGFHSGIDISGGGFAGATIVAADGGTVIVSRNYDAGGYGKYVKIDHGNTYSTLYGHCQQVLVNVGDKVAKGQKIALGDSTGNSTGHHLHFEVRINDEPKNPLNYVSIPGR